MPLQNQHLFSFLRNPGKENHSSPTKLQAKQKPTLLRNYQSTPAQTSTDKSKRSVLNPNRLSHSKKSKPQFGSSSRKSTKQPEMKRIRTQPNDTTEKRIEAIDKLRVKIERALVSKPLELQKRVKKVDSMSFDWTGEDQAEFTKEREKQKINDLSRVQLIEQISTSPLERLSKHLKPFLRSVRYQIQLDSHLRNLKKAFALKAAINPRLWPALKAALPNFHHIEQQFWVMAQQYDPFQPTLATVSVQELAEAFSASSNHYERHIRRSLSGEGFCELMQQFKEKRIRIEGWVSVLNMMLRQDWRSRDVRLLFGRLEPSGDWLYETRLKKILCYQ